jgi:hypothetical protein
VARGKLLAGLERDGEAGGSPFDTNDLPGLELRHQFCLKHFP